MHVSVTIFARSIAVIAVAGSATVAEAASWLDYSMSSMYGPRYAYSPVSTSWYQPGYSVFRPVTTYYGGYGYGSCGPSCGPCGSSCSPCGNTCYSCSPCGPCGGGRCASGNCAFDNSDPTQPRPEENVPKTFGDGYGDDGKSEDDGLREREGFPSGESDAVDPDDSDFTDPGTTSREANRPVTGGDEDSVIGDLKMPPVPAPERAEDAATPDVIPSKSDAKFTWRSAPRRSRLRVKAVYGDPIVERSRPSSNHEWVPATPATKIAGK